MNVLKHAVSAAVILLLFSGFAQAQTPSPKAHVKTTTPITALLGEALNRINTSVELSQSGDKAVQEHSWGIAVAFYQQALALWHDNSSAGYGLARCYRETGNTPKEIEAYRATIYSDNPADFGFRENHTKPLLEFALLLCQNDRDTEAAAVYNHVASLLKYMDGKPSYGYMMPLFGSGPGQVTYTSARLQALVQVGLGIDCLDTQETSREDKIAHLREAARLYPDSPVAYAYLAYQLKLTGDSAGAKAAELQADRLGLLPLYSLLEAQTAQRQAQKADEAAGK